MATAAAVAAAALEHIPAAAGDARPAKIRRTDCVGTSRRAASGGSAEGLGCDAGAGPALLVYLRIEDAGSAVVPAALPLDATIADLKAAAHAAGGAEPRLLLLSVGSQTLTRASRTPLHDTLVCSECTVTVRRAAGTGFVSCGDNFAVVLLQSGRVVAWGDRRAFEPMPDFSPGTVTSVHAGDGFAAAVAAGRLVVWGRYAAHVGCSLSSLAGVEVVCCSAAAPVGCYAVVVVDSVGRLHVCGSRAAVQMIGPVPEWLQGRAVSVSAGRAHVAALTREGTVVRFGGEVPAVEVDLGGKTPLSVSAGGDHCAVLLSDGTVRCFGDNSHGQCDVPEGVDDAVSCVCGSRETAAVCADGRLVWWGRSDSGRPTLAGARWLCGTGLLCV
eukprot:TRINITY_DN10465_c0_g1_i2.p1 TRINITY_DN10465_c0_g1~~TRINITY_DN10465_c0_g1_i2.p1  ORF type:complete len:405 (+),score=100.26 TRINITY_DN10465_c0_g1_i2:63-1217(+)